MTTPHPHAYILRAIADGKQIQYQYCGSEWKDCDPELVLTQLGLDYHSKPSYTLRIAPETITVNGVECPKPVPYPHDRTNWIVVVEYGTAYTGQRSESVMHTFATEADAKTVFDALCKPFKSEGKTP